MPRYSNLSHSEKLFLKYRHECLTLIPSVELTTLLKNPNRIPRKPGVYIMWRKSNDHIYIGESYDVRRRLIEHATVQYPKQYIDRDIAKFGPEHFRVAFIEEVADQKARRIREGEYVALFNSYFNGYNGSKDGNPMTSFQRWWRKVSANIMKSLMPEFVKAQRRRNSFKGWRKLRRHAKRLRRPKNTRY